MLLLASAGCPSGRRPPGQAAPVTTVGAVGDIMLARGVARRASRAGDPARALRKVASRISACDVAFGNLECPLSDGGEKQWKGFAFRADPRRATDLKNAGFDVLCVGNNHAWDYGRRAFGDTRKALKSAGIGAVGIADSRGRSRLLVTRVRGISIGWIAYCDPKIDNYFSRTFTGKIDIALLDRDRLADDVKRAASRVDVLILSLHWGAQYRETVAETRRELARKAVDAGAAVVIGHHPHVLQGVETWNGRPIFYSLGNFIFDQKSRVRNETVIVEIDITRHGAREVRIAPVLIVDGQPRPAAGKEGAAILARMRTMSAGLGTTLAVDSAAGEPIARITL